MKTAIITPLEGGIEQAVKLLTVGEIVALPTETVYGLAGNALNPTAIRKIFAAKNRPQDNPLIVHVSGLDMVENLGLNVTETARRLAERFWEGALTIVFRKTADIIPPEISCGLDSVAVRVPDSPVMLEVIRRCNAPLAAPSANLSGRPSPTTAQHVYDDLSGRIPLIVDGGECGVGIESTVVALENERDGSKIRILRPGAVTAEMLSEFGEVVAGGDSRQSPGTRYRHYSPQAEVIAVEGSARGMGEFVIEEPDMRTLYAKLREFDEAGAARIYISLPEDSGAGVALRDRILRAAGKA